VKQLHNHHADVAVAARQSEHISSRQCLLSTHSTTEEKMICPKQLTYPELIYLEGYIYNPLKDSSCRRKTFRTAVVMRASCHAFQTMPFCPYTGTYVGAIVKSRHCLHCVSPFSFNTFSVVLTFPTTCDLEHCHCLCAKVDKVSALFAP
jgi:hypothetical protein